MSRWRAQLSEDERDALEEASHPDWFSPMQATLTDRRFSDPHWLYEPKLDGERLLAFRHGDKVRLLTRNQKSALSTYPELEEALKQQALDDFVIDGEVVAFKDGLSSFSRLQQRLKITDAEQARNSGIAVHFYIFDLIHADGYRLDALPLRSRKRLLKQLLAFAAPLHFTPHRNEDGEAFFESACESSWEGIIAKRADSPYRHSRTRDWLKFKCEQGQELVIGGFTEPEGERVGFGALLVGYYDDKQQLRYAGKVGTGFDDEFLEGFRARMDKHQCDECPFSETPNEITGHWIKPRFVGEFAFTEWTDDGKLRHPRFLGLRRDKSPEDVSLERPDG